MMYIGISIAYSVLGAIRSVETLSFQHLTAAKSGSHKLKNAFALKMLARASKNAIDNRDI